MNKKSILNCEACGDCFPTGDINEQYIKRHGICKSCFNYFDGFQKWLNEKYLEDAEEWQ